jgi:DNA-binding NarL/FixJ family response regulator
MQHALLFTRSILGAGIQSTLRGIPDWSVWHATTQCPEQMVDLAQRYCPTVTFFDMTCLPVVDLFQLLGQKRVKEVFKVITVATLSGLDEEELFRLSMWGVAAHISGSTEPGDFADILQRVTLGEYLLTEDCLRKVRIPAPRPRSAPVIVESLARTRDTFPVAAEAVPSPLTEREANVLCCIAQGMTNKEVARTLGLAENTVKNYVTSIFGKLQVYDRTSAVVCALRRDWIQVPEVSRARVPREAAVA